MAFVGGDDHTEVTNPFQQRLSRRSTPQLPEHDVLHDGDACDEPQDRRATPSTSVGDARGLGIYNIAGGSASKTKGRLRKQESSGASSAAARASLLSGGGGSLSSRTTRRGSSGLGSMMVSSRRRGSSGVSSMSSTTDRPRSTRGSSAASTLASTLSAARPTSLPAAATSSSLDERPRSLPTAAPPPVDTARTGASSVRVRPQNWSLGGGGGTKKDASVTSNFSEMREHRGIGSIPEAGEARRGDAARRGFSCSRSGSGDDGRPTSLGSYRSPVNGAVADAVANAATAAATAALSLATAANKCDHHSTMSKDWDFTRSSSVDSSNSHGRLKSRGSSGEENGWSEPKGGVSGGGVGHGAGHGRAASSLHARGLSDWAEVEENTDDSVEVDEGVRLSLEGVRGNGTAYQPTLGALMSAKRAAGRLKRNARSNSSGGGTVTISGGGKLKLMGEGGSEKPAPSVVVRASPSPPRTSNWSTVRQAVRGEGGKLINELAGSKGSGARAVANRLISRGSSNGGSAQSVRSASRNSARRASPEPIRSSDSTDDDASSRWYQEHRHRVGSSGKFSAVNAAGSSAWLSEDKPMRNPSIGKQTDEKEIQRASKLEGYDPGRATSSPLSQAPHYVHDLAASRNSSRPPRPHSTPHAHSASPNNAIANAAASSHQRRAATGQQPDTKSQRGLEEVWALVNTGKVPREAYDQLVALHTVKLGESSSSGDGDGDGDSGELPKGMVSLGSFRSQSVERRANSVARRENSGNLVDQLRSVAKNEVCGGDSGDSGGSGVDGGGSDTGSRQASRESMSELEVFVRELIIGELAAKMTYLRVKKTCIERFGYAAFTEHKSLVQAILEEGHAELGRASSQPDLKRIGSQLTMGDVSARVNSRDGEGGGSCPEVMSDSTRDLRRIGSQLAMGDGSLRVGSAPQPSNARDDPYRLHRHNGSIELLRQSLDPAVHTASPLGPQPGGEEKVRRSQSDKSHQRSKSEVEPVVRQHGLGSDAPAANSPTHRRTATAPRRLPMTRKESKSISIESHAHERMTSSDNRPKEIRKLRRSLMPDGRAPIKAPALALHFYRRQNMRGHRSSQESAEDDIQASASFRKAAKSERRTRLSQKFSSMMRSQRESVDTDFSSFDDSAKEADEEDSNDGGGLGVFTMDLERGNSITLATTAEEDEENEEGEDGEETKTKEKGQSRLRLRPSSLEAATHSTETMADITAGAPKETKLQRWESPAVLDSSGCSTSMGIVSHALLSPDVGAAAAAEQPATNSGHAHVGGGGDGSDGSDGNSGNGGDRDGGVGDDDNTRVGRDATERVSGMSVKELKATIENAGLSHVDCIEKPDLRMRAVEALEQQESTTNGGFAEEDDENWALGWDTPAASERAELCVEILLDLVNGEAQYVQNLSTLNTMYRTPLQDASSVFLAGSPSKLNQISQDAFGFTQQKATVSPVHRTRRPGDDGPPVTKPSGWRNMKRRLSNAAMSITGQRQSAKAILEKRTPAKTLSGGMGGGRRRGSVSIRIPSVDATGRKGRRGSTITAFGSMGQEGAMRHAAHLAHHASSVGAASFVNLKAPKKYYDGVRIPSLDEATVKELFGNLQDLQRVNTMLLEDLEKGDLRELDWTHGEAAVDEAIVFVCQVLHDYAR